MIADESAVTFLLLADDIRVLHSRYHMMRVAVGWRLPAVAVLDAILHCHLRSDDSLATHFHPLRIAVKCPDDMTSELRCLRRPFEVSVFGWVGCNHHPEPVGE